MSDISDLGELGELGELGDLGELIRMSGMQEPMETRLLRALAEQPGAVSAGFVEWLVTGHFPEPAIRCDIARVRGDLLQY